MTTRQSLLFAALGCLAAAAYGGGEGTSTEAGREVQSNHQVTMTWVSGSNRYAAINGGFYTVGDTLPDGTDVLAIESGMVRLSRDGVAHRVGIVDKPPSRKTFVLDDQALTPLSYLDHAIAELERAGGEGPGRSAPQPRLEELNSLRDRLTAARDRLANGEVSDAERARIETEMNVDWLQAQQKLDLLRHRVADSGSGLGIEELQSTQKILEDAALAALRLPLAQLQNREFEALMAGQQAGLLESATETLASYPDYHALVEKLERFQADQVQ